MARTIRDTYPEITIVPSKPFPHPPSAAMTRAEAEDARDEILELIKRHVDPSTRRHLDITTTLVDNAICEHCRYTWTEAAQDYNGGCCGKDEANNPTRLAELRAQCEAIEDETFYDAEASHRVSIDWAPTLASAALKWLDDGRPADGVASLVPLIKRVSGREWCTIWTDPGPSGCSLPRLPNEVRADSRPDDLAGELLSLIDDMGLPPARQAEAV